jgi:hypothetical protein
MSAPCNCRVLIVTILLVLESRTNSKMRSQMKLTATLDLECVITKFEGYFDYSTMEYKEVNNAEKQIMCNNFDNKKFRLIFDLSHKLDEEEGYTVHATATHFKKAKISLRIDEKNITVLSVKSDVQIPLRLSSKKTSDFNLKAIYADLSKGKSEEVKLYFEEVEITKFKLVD